MLNMIELWDIKEVQKEIKYDNFIFPCPNRCGATFATSLLPEYRDGLNLERICPVCKLRIRETKEKIFIIDDEKWLDGDKV